MVHWIQLTAIDCVIVMVSNKVNKKKSVHVYYLLLLWLALSLSECT
jgi:hypothetical protein